MTTIEIKINGQPVNEPTGFLLQKPVGYPGRYSNEFKLDAIKTAKRVGQSLTSKVLDVPKSTLYGWCKTA